MKVVFIDKYMASRKLITVYSSSETFSPQNILLKYIATVVRLAVRLVASLILSNTEKQT